MKRHLWQIKSNQRANSYYPARLRQFAIVGESMESLGLRLDSTTVTLIKASSLVSEQAGVTLSARNQLPGAVNAQVLLDVVGCGALPRLGSRSAIEPLRCLTYE